MRSRSFSCDSADTQPPLPPIKCFLSPPPRAQEAFVNASMLLEPSSPTENKQNYPNTPFPILSTDCISHILHYLPLPSLLSLRASSPSVYNLFTSPTATSNIVTLPFMERLVREMRTMGWWAGNEFLFAALTKPIKENPISINGVKRMIDESDAAPVVLQIMSAAKIEGKIDDTKTSVYLSDGGEMVQCVAGAEGFEVGKFVRVREGKKREVKGKVIVVLLDYSVLPIPAVTPTFGAPAPYSPLTPPLTPPPSTYNIFYNYLTLVHNYNTSFPFEVRRQKYTTATAHPSAGCFVCAAGLATGIANEEEDGVGEIDDVGGWRNYLRARNGVEEIEEEEGEGIYVGWTQQTKLLTLECEEGCGKVMGLYDRCNDCKDVSNNNKKGPYMCRLRCGGVDCGRYLKCKKHNEDQNKCDFCHTATCGDRRCNRSLIGKCNCKHGGCGFRVCEGCAWIVDEQGVVIPNPDITQWESLCEGCATDKRNGDGLFGDTTEDGKGDCEDENGWDVDGLEGSDDSEEVIDYVGGGSDGGESDGGDSDGGDSDGGDEFADSVECEYEYEKAEGEFSEQEGSEGEDDEEREIKKRRFESGGEESSEGEAEWDGK